MKFFGIRNKETKIPLSFRTSINNSGDDGEVEFWLEYSEQPSNVWLLPSRFNVEKAMSENWYGSYERPLVYTAELKLSFDNWEIFEVEI